MLVDGDMYRAEFETKIHQTIKKVSNDFESLKFNTAIAAMMALVNDFYKANSITKGEYATLILLLNPVAPHMTEELWEAYFGNGRAYQQKWPEYDEAKTVESTVEIAVQINGKVKATLMVGLDEDEASIKEKAHDIPVITELTSGKNIMKEIYVKGRILNIVAK
jgi:leucyl-tRNA synthetase